MSEERPPLTERLKESPWAGCFVLAFVGIIGGGITGFLINRLAPWSVDLPVSLPIRVFLPLAVVGALPPIAVLGLAYALLRWVESRRVKTKRPGP